MDTQNHKGENASPNYKLAFVLLAVFFAGQVTGYYTHSQPPVEKPAEVTPVYYYDSYYGESSVGGYEEIPDPYEVTYGDEVDWEAW
jgi:hypothetical protein